MLRTTKARLAASRQEEGGFTLIELMVVVLIIAILLAIAIPTFLGAQNKAKDRSAQSSLRNALTAAKTVYADKQAYTTADSSATGLKTIEPSLTYKAKDAASTGPKDVSVDPGAAGSQEWYGAALSKTNDCFYIKDTAGAGTKYAKAASDKCKGSDAQALNDASYSADGW
jgi:type IV pilus assembly protein PilA